jgi:hypothetical protein
LGVACVFYKFEFTSKSDTYCNKYFHTFASIFLFSLLSMWTSFWSKANSSAFSLTRFSSSFYSKQSKLSCLQGMVKGKKKGKWCIRTGTSDTNSQGLPAEKRVQSVAKLHIQHISFSGRKGGSAVKVSNMPNGHENQSDPFWF